VKNNNLGKITFKLSKEFINKYRYKTPPFGFNGLGFLVYMRTYSRLKSDGENEQWYETVERVVNGIYSMQKNHIDKYGLGWTQSRAQQSAQEMYDRMYNMKFLPPGRGLWGVGTGITKRGLFAALNNCAFVSTENIDKEFTKPFEFLMDMSMLGAGVGFDVKGEGKIMIKTPGNEISYIIPDTREGWVESIKILLNAYFQGHGQPKFDYSQIRLEGEPIKTFGGTACGPKPLEYLHNQIRNIFKNKIGKEITITNIVDLMNMIGCCVVSGNVRRTAEIVFGPPNNEEYLKLKDYRWNGKSYEGSMKHRAKYGWASNNSIYADLGMDYTKVGNQTGINGEPGYEWIENIRAFSKMNGHPDYKDKKCAGSNPCNEQSLESYEMCCLCETFPSRHDSLDDFKRTLKFAYLYAKTVTLGPTHWAETNRVMLRNRRIGTSQSGIVMAIQKLGLHEYKKWCEEGYKTIESYDEIYSDWLCIPKSIKKTSIKPSGTVSLLPGVTPGMHYPESNYYIRRVRLSKFSPLVKECKNAGYKVEKSVTDNNSVIVEIPVSIENIRTVDQVDLWEQVSLAAFLQRYWADNQVSCTITFPKERGNEINNILNYFQYQLKGISFLPKLETAVYPQMPYEAITKEQYNSKVNKIKEIKRIRISEDSIPEKYCDGNTCEVLAV